MKTVIISDIDLSARKGAGIPIYVEGLVRNLPGEKVVIGKGKGDWLGCRTIGISAKSNYEHFFKLFLLDKSFISKEDILVSQRPDFIYPFLNLGCRKIVTVHGDPASIIMKKKGGLTHRFYRYFESVSLKKADQVIFIDSRARAKYAGSAVVIPPGIDTNLFKPMDKASARRKLGLPSGRMLLFCGRLAPEKNIRRIVDELRGKKLTFLIIGEGPEKIEEGGNIRLLGTVSHEDLPLYMTAADALILMSESEGLPTVVLEAMACGTPVISRDVGDIGKVVIEGKTGFLTEFGSIEQKADKLKDMSKGCRKMALGYSWKSIARKLWEVYR